MIPKRVGTEVVFSGLRFLGVRRRKLHLFVYTSLTSWNTDTGEVDHTDVK